MSRETNIKTERDRFVAFAFCWADIVLELDLNFNIVFAGGAVTAVTGKPESDLEGTPVTDLIAEDDHLLFVQVTATTDEHNRIAPVSVRLAGRKGPTPRVEMMGYRIQDLKNHLFLAFRLGDGFRQDAIAKRDQESGLIDGDSFAQAAEVRIRDAANHGESLEMTMLDMDQLQELANSLGNEDAGHLMQSVGSYLKTSSLGGDSAARIDDNKFSLVHSSDLNVEDIQSTLTQMATNASDGGATIEIKATTMEVDAAEISDEDLANGLAYTINQFKKSQGSEFSTKNLALKMSDLAKEAHERITSFRRAVSDHDYYIAFHPIIRIKDGKIPFYECLARFRDQGAAKSPYEHILFAEETGMIPEFDFDMAKTALQWLGQQPQGNKCNIAINVSGYSIGDPTYIQRLVELLHNNSWAQGSVMFEITDSAQLKDMDKAVRFTRNLRKMGYKVCLDDFGAGAASFQYLSSMQVDVVKLDGSALKAARKAPKGRAFLVALGNLCRELGIETIAETIDDPEGLQFARDCGMGYAQGYLFGKPSPDIKTFDPLPNANLLRSRR